MCYLFKHSDNISQQCQNYNDYEIFTFDRITYNTGLNLDKCVIMDYGYNAKYAYKADKLFQYCMQEIDKNNTPRDPLCRKEISIHKLHKLAKKIMLIYF